MINTTIDSGIRPAPILLHAYHRVNKAFQGHIAINTYTQDLAISSEKKEFHRAVRHILQDIQLAYTSGNLNNELISNIIALHLPEELRQDSDLSFFATEYTFSKDISEDGLHTLKQIIDAINTQIPDICTINEDNSVSIKASDPKQFANVFNVIRDAQDSIEKGERLSDKKIRYIVKNNFLEGYKNLNIRAVKRSKRREQQQKAKNRVVTHKVMIVDNVNGVDLQPLSAHLLARGKKEDYPFSAFEEYHCFAKATRNSKGIPCIRLQLPVYLESDFTRDRELERRMKNVLATAASAFNNDENQVIDHDFISELIKNDKSGISADKFARQEKSASKKDIKFITGDDLYLTIVDWLPIDLERIMDNIGANKKDSLHRAYISSLMRDFIDEGLIVENEQGYMSPEPFHGRNVMLGVTARDEQGRIYARPCQWDETLYGVKPEIVLSEEMTQCNDITIYDIITANLKYHMGFVENITITNIERLHELVTDDSDVFLEDQDDDNITHENHNENHITVRKNDIKPPPLKYISSSDNIYIAEDAEVPADGIITGVVGESCDVMFFKPSMQGIGSFIISPDENKNYESGDIIRVKISPEQRRVEEILQKFGNINEPAGLSKLSAVEQGIPLEFPEDILLDTPALVVPPPSKNRADFRDIPCITIDPPTAKDFDDAIYVERNDQGWRVMVFIADVSHYLKPDTKLFEEAYLRGNSTYLPDLTIPMLPEEISNVICSLVPNEDRACLVTTMQINHEGEITEKRFDRALMRSVARLDYDQVQDAINGNFDEKTLPIYESHIVPAFEVFKALSDARERRGALNFNTPEQRIDLTGEEERITLEIHNESHGIIEELMIASNIAAIETLIEHKSKLIARVHGLPNERVLKQFAGQLRDFGITMPSDSIAIEERVEQILKQAQGLPHEDDIRRLMVRCQDKAKYSATLSEHYALKLDAYTHETSPIRRMTDWYIHCLLNEACNLKEGARLTPDMKKQLGEAAEQFSMSERRSDLAERKTKLRLTSSWVKGKLGEEFDATVTHVTDKGIFIKIADKEIRSFISSQDLSGKFSSTANSNGFYSSGKTLRVTPVEADEVTGIIKFDIA